MADGDREGSTGSLILPNNLAHKIKRAIGLKPIALFADLKATRSTSHLLCPPHGATYGKVKFTTRKPFDLSVTLRDSL